MNFTHTDDRRMLADMAERFVREKYPIEKRHEIAASDEGFSREIWSELAELGLIGAVFPEEAGGFGGHPFDIAVVFEELGKGLVVEPFLANLLAGSLLSRAGNDLQKSVLEGVIGGETLLALAHGEPASRYSLSHVETTAKKDGGEYVLNGNKAVVIRGDSADHLVVSARTSGEKDDENGISLFLVKGDADGLSRRGYGTADGYRAAEIALKDVHVPADALIGSAHDAYANLEVSYALGIIAVSAEALGAMKVAADLTLDYLKTRKQFGVVIGKFQALQHRMADMLTEVEQVRSALINACGYFDSDERDWHISALKNLVGRTGRLVGEEAIQMHGGIAMTWEYAVGHYSKRLVMIDHLFGDTDHHLEQVMKLSKAS